MMKAVINGESLDSFFSDFFEDIDDVEIKDTVTQISTFIKSPFITFKSIKQSIKGFTKTLNNKDG